MTMQAKNEILAAVHEMALDMNSVGAISKERMNYYETICLEPLPTYTGSMIKNLRLKLDISQAYLASLLNTSISAVCQWEQGKKKPSGTSSKLLYLLDKNGTAALL